MQGGRRDGWLRLDVSPVLGLLSDKAGLMSTCTHVLLVCDGDYADGTTETWQFGLRFFVQNSGTTPDESGTLPTFLNTPATVARTEADWTIASTWNGDLGTISLHPDDWLNDQVAPAIYANFGYGISHNCRMRSIKASPIKADGHVADLETCVLTWTGSYPQGSTTGNMCPPQDSMVVSTNTPRLGNRGRGRYFLPAMGVSDIESDGRMSSTAKGNLLTAQVAMLEGMAITDSITPSLWVIPAVIGSPWTEYGQITSIDIGNVVDTQRRRRRSLIEVRTSSDVSY